MADHPLITSQLQTLASRLPPPLFAEIADGLQETYQAQLIRQPDPRRAALAAVAQFGDADTITRALCHQAPWRRHAAALLVTGPLLGTIWATTLITQQAWLWSLPWIARGLFAAALLLVVVLLTRAMKGSVEAAPEPPVSSCNEVARSVWSSQAGTHSARPRGPARNCV